MRCPQVVDWGLGAALSITVRHSGTSLGTAFLIAVVAEARCGLCDVALGQQRRVWGRLDQSHPKITGRRRNESVLGLAPRQILLPFYCYKRRGAEVPSPGLGEAGCCVGHPVARRDTGDTGHELPDCGEISSLLSQPACAAEPQT